MLDAVVGAVIMVVATTSFYIRLMWLRKRLIKQVDIP